LLSLFVCRGRVYIVGAMCVKLAANGLQLQEVGDFGDENCLPALNLIRSKKLHVTTEPPISCRCCYMRFFFSLVSFFVVVLLSVFIFLSRFNFPRCVNFPVTSHNATVRHNFVKNFAKSKLLHLSFYHICVFVCTW